MHILEALAYRTKLTKLLKQLFPALRTVAYNTVQQLHDKKYYIGLPYPALTTVLIINILLKAWSYTCSLTVYLKAKTFLGKLLACSLRKVPCLNSQESSFPAYLEKFLSQKSCLPGLLEKFLTCNVGQVAYLLSQIICLPALHYWTSCLPALLEKLLSCTL